MLATVVLLTIPIICLIYLYKRYVNKFEDLKKIPGPSISDLFHFYIRNSSDGLLSYLQTLNKTFGPVVKIWIKPFNPILITEDMQFVEQIYKSNDLFQTPTLQEISGMLRNSLATTKIREFWKRDKQTLLKALTPKFTFDHLAVYNRNYSKLKRLIDDKLGKEINIEAIMARIFAEITIELINDPEIKVTSEEMGEYIQSRNEYFDLLLEKMNSPMMSSFLHRFTYNYKRSKELGDKMIGLIEEFLMRHKNVPYDKREKTNLIYSMMESDMPEDRIVDNINVFINAAFDTSILPFCLTLRELAKNPKLQQKTFNEIQSVIGTEKSAEITLNDLSEMTFLNCVLKEATRLFFPAPFADRKLIEDLKINGMRIPKGTLVFFHLREVLRSDKWFENGRDFKPERFFEENFDENAKKAYLAFGFGLKTCLGKNLASAGLKFLIANVLRDFEVMNYEGSHEGELQLKAHIIFKSIEGVNVVFKKRN